MRSEEDEQSLIKLMFKEDTTNSLIERERKKRKRKRKREKERKKRKKKREEGGW